MNPSELTLFRAKKGLTITALADLLGVNKSTALRWERDGIPIAKLARVQKATGIDMKKLRPSLFNEAK
jgi:transcriptional regulator with XRE-family HTH domain